MKNKELAAALAPRQAALDAERDALLAQIAPLHEQRDALIAQIQPLEAQLRKVQQQIKAIEQPRLRDIGNELAAIARALGARSLVNE